ncbi:fucolectin-like [Phyllobates terribilis]|uniref:fucolectin-like n=1 Tax=Phyllobates terribilis TaxID=111132 RepID=UPI003CCA8751
MNLLSSLILLGSVVLVLGCAPAPGATNIARNGEASQLSDYVYPIMGYAKNAIDGIKDTNYHKGSCTHTNYEKNPWWKLDLKQTYKIANVVISNRMDCCKERLTGAEIRIGNSADNNNPVCDKVKNVASATLSFCCNGMEGQYVSVVIPGRSESLSLCEVEVYGDPINRANKVCW